MRWSSATSARGGQFVQTQSSEATGDWTHIVSVGSNLVFYRSDDGLLATTSLNNQYHLVQGKSTTMEAGFDQVVAVGEALVFYSVATGALLIAHMDEAGHLVPTQQSAAVTNWQKLVWLSPIRPVSSNLVGRTPPGTDSNASPAAPTSIDQLHRRLEGHAGTCRSANDRGDPDAGNEVRWRDGLVPVCPPVRATAASWPALEILF